MAAVEAVPEAQETVEIPQVKVKKVRVQPTYMATQAKITYH